MTVGEQRVRINHGENGLVMKVKENTAREIDFLEDLKGIRSDNPEIVRCIAIAQTKLEEACMFAVKALTT